MFGLNRLKTCSVAAAFVAAALVGAAQASTVDCGGNSLSSTDTVMSCYGSGTMPSFLDPALTSALTSDGYIYTGGIRPLPVGDISGFDDMVSLIGGIGGSFDITSVVNAVIVFSMRPTDCVPGAKCQVDYVAYQVTTTAAALLDWTSDSVTGLRRVSIYLKPAAVPLPAAGLLLLGGIGALGAAKRRRRQAA